MLQSEAGRTPQAACGLNELFVMERIEKRAPEIRRSTNLEVRNITNPGQLVNLSI